MFLAVDITPIFAYLNEALMLLLGGVALWAGAWGIKFLREHTAFLDEDTQRVLAEGLNRALQNGVAIAMQKLEAWEKLNSSVETKSAVITWAAQHAIDYAPDAVAKFGLNLDDLAVKAVAYLPPPSVTMDAKIATREKIETGPLPPVQ